MRFLKNLLNRKKTSQITKGVSYDKDFPKTPYRAYLTVKRKHKDRCEFFFIGRYATKKEAVKARLQFIENLK